MIDAVTNTVQLDTTTTNYLIHTEKHIHVCIDAVGGTIVGLLCFYPSKFFGIISYAVIEKFM